jgi:putative thioredoxin
MEATDSNFDEKVIKASEKKLVVADFWATWCFPCTMLAPVLEKVVNSCKGKVILAKINVDENPAKSNEYEISAIPAVKLFKKGKVVDEFTGAIPEEKIKQIIEKHL